MKDILNQFIDNLNGQFVEVSYKEALYQCMDLAYDWIFCLGYPKATIQHTYAYQVYTEPSDLTRKYFDIIPNTPDAIPQDGDLVVLKGGEAGHIVIALGGGSTSKFVDFEQNNPLGTNAHIQSRSYTNVLGWLRPKYEFEPKITDQTRLPILDENGNQMEVQATRSRLADNVIEITNLKRSVTALQAKTVTLQGQVDNLPSNTSEGVLLAIYGVLYGPGFWWTKWAKIKVLLPK